jgi:CopG antitoxin of type II toxin-antitoxin system
MGANKTTSISGASSYREIGEYWDDHDLSDHSDTAREVAIDVDIRSSSVYFAVEKSLAEKLRSVAHDHGVSPENLLDQWVREHIADEPPAK